MPVSESMLGESSLVGEVAALSRVELAERYGIEMRLSTVAAGGGGLCPLVQAVSETTGKPCYLIDSRNRVVAHRTSFVSKDIPVPKLRSLLEAIGPHNLERPEPTTVAASRARGLARRHLVTPVTREGQLFAWLVVTEHPTRFTRADCYVVWRAANYLAAEYQTQRRIARVAWNARASLARQLLRGTSDNSDLRGCAEYLGVDLEADRVVAFVAPSARPPATVFDADHLAELVAEETGVEVLPVRGSEGVALVISCSDRSSSSMAVGGLKPAVVNSLRALGDEQSVIGLSAATTPLQLRRAYREAREVALCVGRFTDGRTRVIAADDLGPARLFIANSDVTAVRTFMRDVLGALLNETPGMSDLLRTLQFFFEADRSVRESARLLGVHENTVRLRLSKVHDVTGFDVAAASNDQLSVQTALLVLRLQGHPGMPTFAQQSGYQRQESA